MYQKSNKKVNVSFQLIPVNEANAYSIVDEAIKVIQDSGIRYQVQPFATLMEGELNHLLGIINQAKEAALKAGAKELILNIQVHLKNGEDVVFEDKTAKFN